MNPLKIKIPLAPISMNSLYQINYRMREVTLKSEAYTWRTRAKEFIPKSSIKWEHIRIVYTLIIHDNWYFKNGKFKKLDVQNLEKLLIDGVSQKLGFDDCGIWIRDRLIKYQDLKWKGIRMIIWPLSDQAYERYLLSADLDWEHA